MATLACVASAAIVSSSSAGPLVALVVVDVEQPEQRGRRRAAAPCRSCRSPPGRPRPGCPRRAGRRDSSSAKSGRRAAIAADGSDRAGKSRTAEVYSDESPRVTSAVTLPSAWRRNTAPRSPSKRTIAWSTRPARIRSRSSRLPMSPATRRSASARWSRWATSSSRRTTPTIAPSASATTVDEVAVGRVEPLAGPRDDEQRAPRSVATRDRGRELRPRSPGRTVRVTAIAAACHDRGRARRLVRAAPRARVAEVDRLAEDSEPARQLEQARRWSAERYRDGDSGRVARLGRSQIATSASIGGRAQLAATRSRSPLQVVGPRVRERSRRAVRGRASMPDRVVRLELRSGPSARLVVAGAHEADDAPTR